MQQSPSGMVTERPKHPEMRARWKDQQGKMHSFFTRMVPRCEQQFDSAHFSDPGRSISFPLNVPQLPPFDNSNEKARNHAFINVHSLLEVEWKCGALSMNQVLVDTRKSSVNSVSLDCKLTGL